MNELSSYESYCGRPKMRNTVLEGLRDRKLEDNQLDTLVIMFSRWVMLCEKSRAENDKRSWVSSAERWWFADELYMTVTCNMTERDSVGGWQVGYRNSRSNKLTLIQEWSDIDPTVPKNITSLYEPSMAQVSCVSWCQTKRVPVLLLKHPHSGCHYDDVIYPLDARLKRPCLEQLYGE